MDGSSWSEKNPGEENDVLPGKDGETMGKAGGKSEGKWWVFSPCRSCFERRAQFPAMNVGMEGVSHLVGCSQENHQNICEKKELPFLV